MDTDGGKLFNNLLAQSVVEKPPAPIASGKAHDEAFRKLITSLEHHAVEQTLFDVTRTLYNLHPQLGTSLTRRFHTTSAWDYLWPAETQPAKPLNTKPLGQYHRIPVSGPPVKNIQWAIFVKEYFPYDGVDGPHTYERGLLVSADIDGILTTSTGNLVKDILYSTWSGAKSLDLANTDVNVSNLIAQEVFDFLTCNFLI